MSAANEISYDRLLATIARFPEGRLYPPEFARQTGLDRSQLERALDQLRLSGLIELSMWESGRGQGVQLTDAGVQVVTSPRLLARLARGELPAPGQVRGRMASPHSDGSTYGRGESIRSTFLEPFEPRLTIALIVINVIIFAIGQVIALRGANPGVVQFGNIQALISTGAVSGVFLLEGQWWRLITCCFVHIGAIHLLMNMLSLWSLGPVQERIWGRGRFMCIYLIAGFAGSCAGMTRHPEGLLAGASGAIWGLMTALIVWVFLNRSHLPRELVTSWINSLGTSLALNLIISFMPGISLEGHLGGGIAGAIVAALLHFHRFGRPSIRWLAIVGIAIVPLISLGLIFAAQHQSTRWAKVIKAHQQSIERQRPPLDDGEEF